MRFKEWLLSEISSSSMILSGPEVEYDQFQPDDGHVQQSLNIVRSIKGFFPAFRSKLKDYMILQAFEEAIKQGFPRNGGSPFNYSKDGWLNDEVQTYVAQRMGMQFQEIEPYCERLRHYFQQIWDESKKKNWDYKQAGPSYPDVA